MACVREQVEITALTNNLQFITNTVGQNLEWFANQLVAKAFIPFPTALGILGTNGLVPAAKAGQLMSSVFTQIRGSPDRKRHWFNEFVDIFSHDRAYQGLVESLMKEVVPKAAVKYSVQERDIKAAPNGRTGKLDINRDLGVAKDILQRRLDNNVQLRDLFDELGLANKTLKNNFHNYGVDQYADDLVRAWINGRDDVLKKPEYPGGARWENLRKALDKKGHGEAAQEI